MSQEQNGAGEDGRNTNQPGGRSLRERMTQDLQLRGMAERTQKGYLREVP